MNSTEKFVRKIYNHVGISDATDISIDKIANSLDLEVLYWPYSSELVYYKSKFKLFLNELLTKQLQWRDFGHELSHYFTDHTQPYLLRDSFVDYCETKADYFAYHFCVPTFMLQQLKGVDVYKVMNLFNVEYDFALRRLEMYQSKLIMKGEAKWQKVT